MKVDLELSRVKQETKRNQTITIPGGLIDMVDYAQIERDHAEFLRLMIENAPYILKTQYRQFIGKSRTHGNNLVEFLIDRNVVGEGDYRGIKYLYPLKKAMVWYSNKTFIKGYRQKVSQKFLLENFHRAEWIIKQQQLEFIDDVINYLCKINYPDIYLFIEKGNGQFSRMPIKQLIINDKAFKNHIKGITTKLSPLLNLTIFGFKDSKVLYSSAYIIHRDGYDFETYYDVMSSFWRFADSFVVEKGKVLKLDVLVEHESQIEDVEAYYIRAQKKVKYENNKNRRGEIMLMKKIYDLNLARYYQKEYLDDEFITAAEEENIKNVKTSFDKANAIRNQL